MKIQDLIHVSSKLPLTRGAWSIQSGMEHLIKVDSKFVQLFEEFGIPSHYNHEYVSMTSSSMDSENLSPNDPFNSLLKTIIFQQLSAKASQPILDRFIGACGGTHYLTPAQVQQCKFGTILVDGKNKITANCVVSGLSQSKANYIQDLARHFSDDQLLKSTDFHSISDEALYEKLIVVKGLGPWSVHMFMLFQLQRSDVLPIGDLGVRRGLCHFFNLASPAYLTMTNAKSKYSIELQEKCTSWSPYSSLASSLMWKLSDKLTQPKWKADKNDSVKDISEIKVKDGEDLILMTANNKNSIDTSIDVIKNQNNKISKNTSVKRSKGRPSASKDAVIIAPTQSHTAIVDMITKSTTEISVTLPSNPINDEIPRKRRKASTVTSDAVTAAATTSVHTDTTAAAASESIMKTRKSKRSV